MCDVNPCCYAYNLLSNIALFQESSTTASYGWPTAANRSIDQKTTTQRMNEDSNTTGLRPVDNECIRMEHKFSRRVALLQKYNLKLIMNIIIYFKQLQNQITNQQ